MAGQIDWTWPIRHGIWNFSRNCGAKSYGRPFSPTDVHSEMGIYYKKSNFEQYSPNWSIILQNISNRCTNMHCLVRFFIIDSNVHPYYDDRIGRNIVSSMLNSSSTVYLDDLSKGDAPWNLSNGHIDGFFLSVMLGNFVVLSLMKAMLSASVVIKPKLKPANSFSEINQFT